MTPSLFTIASYIGDNEWFHFARKELTEQRPVQPHYHDYFEVFLVERGQAWHSVNGIEQRLQTGSIVFVRPDDVHAIAASKGTCRIINIMFRIETAEHLVARYSDAFEGRFFWSPGLLPTVAALTGPRIERAINTMLELQTTHRRLELIEEFLMTLLVRVVDLPETSGAKLPGWLVDACARAREPEVFRVGASALVAEAGRGHEHVCRAMKAHLGLTPTAYINRIRMEQAALMLASSNAPIADVALACGIENLSHFYRTFRGHYGRTPRSYRQEHGRSPF
ncbi:MAG: AraC family transcriptional regulator [Paracoccaceae bacterium]|nr:AraC family transcriptional regulator [Paracoccaceae bacterium]